MVDRMTVPSLAPPPGYAHVAVVEPGQRLVFTAGAMPLTADGALVGPGDPQAQARQVITNLATSLRAAGSDLELVVATTVYVVASHPEELAAVWEVVRASALTTGPHTSTLTGVTCLGHPGQLVEITAVAVVCSPGLASGAQA